MRNIVMQGDCLELLAKVPENSVDLVYLDPPFFSQKEQRLQTRDGAQTYFFDDSWPDLETYRVYMKLRLRAARRALKDTGSLFLHCDRSASHHLRLALDEVFGEEQFQSEIVWSYRRWSNAKKGLLHGHQLIFFYSKTAHFKFNAAYEEYSPTTNLDQILQERTRDARGKSAYKKSSPNGRPLLMNDKKGVPLSDVWEIPFLNPKAKERVGYPTQKPIPLLEKIIELVTDEGDLVLDPFAGSGTTLVAAKLKGRDYLGFDTLAEAVELSNKRLQKPVRSKTKKKEDHRQQSPLTAAILKQIGGVVVHRNKGIDGFLRTPEGLVPVKVQKPDETLDEAREKLIKASKKNKYPRRALLTIEATEDAGTQDLGLFQDPRQMNFWAQNRL